MPPVDHTWTKNELKAECRERGISYHGLHKDEIIAALNSCVDDSWTKKDLREECRVRGIRFGGLSKDELIDELNSSSRPGVHRDLPHAPPPGRSGLAPDSYEDETLERLHASMAQRKRRRVVEVGARANERSTLEARGGWGANRASAQEVTSRRGAAQAGGVSGEASSSTSDPAGAVEDRNLGPNDHACRICMDAEVNCTLVPCGHYCCCFECAAMLDLCPYCRADVTQKVKTFRA